MCGEEKQRSAACPWGCMRLSPSDVFEGRTWLPVLVAIFLFLPSGLAGPAVEVCEACKSVIGGKMFLVEDKYHHKSRLYCEACTRAVTHCEVCAMPVHAQYGLHLPDGRAYCAEDVETAVMKEEVGKNLFSKARDEAVRILAPYPPLPKLNVSFHLVTREEFNREYRRTPGIDDPTALLGLTISPPEKDGAIPHAVYLLHGIPQNQFLAVSAHEYTHTWLNERTKNTRQLHKDTREAICELLAYKVMGTLGLDEEQKRITEGTYTRGQFGVLLEAEKKYGFHRVIQWTDSGVDSWLESTNLARLLELRDVEAPTLLTPEWPRPVPTSVPDTLVLKGLSGVGVRRFALVNDATLMVGEEARVRLGNTNVLVRCLSIDSNSVSIQMGGEAVPRQLRLQARKDL